MPGMTSMLHKESFFQLVGPELQELEQVVLRELENYDPTLVAASMHLMKAGGKRLRPVMVLLAGRASGHGEVGEPHHHLAMAVEILHTATLIHDDIIDGSALRRGLPTVNQQWGLRTSVLTGDFLLARSCYYISLIEKVRLNTIFSQMVMDMCNGEMSQLERRYRVSISYEQYLEQVRCKTALLMAVGCQGAAIISGAGRAEEDALYAYGHELGIAFQIMDDMLDFTVSTDEMGKSACNDLIQGQITLPTWYALHDSPDADELRSLIEKRFEGEGDLVRGLEIVRASHGLERSEADARRHADQALAALEILPASPARQALADLAEFAIQRRH